MKIRYELLSFVFFKFYNIMEGRIREPKKYQERNVLARSKTLQFLSPKQICYRCSNCCLYLQSFIVYCKANIDFGCISCLTYCSWIALPGFLVVNENLIWRSFDLYRICTVDIESSMQTTG